ncbi:hypothetical protein FHU36_008585 [Nonomuraea muscovyensis]|uniref:Uncharacterized protein n=1 Tax=Nonomuraea muscovyensis TaxID=1124761 RepID=A0A7X0CBB0_9ACTN|nr:hypothetical protein [Nonomuraea muscovyensis]MBB6352002.1 hypothetical protein [Nonomuraea muscovyensis]
MTALGRERLADRRQRPADRRDRRGGLSSVTPVTCATPDRDTCMDGTHFSPFGNVFASETAVSTSRSSMLNQVNAHDFWEADTAVAAEADEEARMPAR